jgi:hypothetical protein
MEILAGAGIVCPGGRFALLVAAIRFSGISLPAPLRPYATASISDVRCNGVSPNWFRWRYVLTRVAFVFCSMARESRCQNTAQILFATLWLLIKLTTLSPQFIGE